MTLALLDIFPLSRNMLLFLVKSRTWDLVCQQHHCKIIHLSYLPPWQQSFDWLIWSQTTFTFTFHIWHNRKQNIGCTYIFHRKKSKSPASNLDDDVPTWSLKDHVGTSCLRTISVRSKSKCIKKSIKHRYFVHLFRFPAKKAWKCEKKYTFWQMISCWDICHLSGC